MLSGGHVSRLNQYLYLVGGLGSVGGVGSVGGSSSGIQLDNDPETAAAMLSHQTHACVVDTDKLSKVQHRPHLKTDDNLLHYLADKNAVNRGVNQYLDRRAMC